MIDMKRLICILTIPLLLLFWQCNSFLDVVPEEDMTTLNSIFETRENADSWLMSCYAFLQKTLPDVAANEAFMGADELVAGDYLRNSTLEWTGLRIASGLQNSLDPYGNLWVNEVLMQQNDGSMTLEGREDYYSAINLCNIFIEKIDQVYNMEHSEKREWKAEVKAVKAYYYFELVRHYGPIILMPKSVDPNISVEAMKMPRSHVDSCFAAIVRLCDEAADSLRTSSQQESSRRAYFCKEAALALKARALLYQASDLFNGNPDYADFVNKNGEHLFSTVKDKEKWRLAAEAAEEAIRVATESGKRLIDDQVGATDLQTVMLNIENSILTYGFSNDEVLWMIKRFDNGRNGDSFYTYTVPRLSDDAYGYNRGTCISPSLKMVEMFYTANGLPIDQDPTYGGGNIYGMTREIDPYYTDVVAIDEDIPVLHTKREPRFYVDIAADRCYWRQGSTQEELYKVEAYQGERFGMQETRINATVPQNLSGYWLKKWLCSTVSMELYSGSVNSLGDSPYPVFRLAELYLIAAEAWNEYLDAPDDRVYDNIDVVRERAGIPDVRTSWAMARDKNRVNTQNGMREIIRQEWNIEFAFEGMRYWNLRRWKTAHVELNESMYGWNVVGSTANSFYRNGRPVVVYSGNTFVAPRDYLYPISSEEIMKSGCVQNPGW